MWKAKFAPDAKADLKKLDKAFAKQVLKGIAKVRKNPLPRPDGYGKPLGNRQGNNLSGFLKIKLKSLGMRIVYKLIKIDGQMLVVVIGARADDEVYDTAKKRVEKHDI